MMISSRSIARSSGERGWRKRCAVAVSWAAWLSAPTAVASKSPSPSTAKAPERTSSPVFAHHRLGLAGQLGLVERQPLGAHQLAVGGDLVAAGDPHQVADHDLARPAPGAARRRGPRSLSRRPAPRACPAPASPAPPGRSRSRRWRRGCRGRARPWGCRRRSSPIPNPARIRLKTVKVLAIAIET